jgi:hypothetical protein
MMLKHHSIVAVKVAKVLRNLQTRFTPICAVIFDEVVRLLWFTSILIQASCIDDPNIEKRSRRR